MSRDITLEDTIYILFTTRSFSTGAPTQLAGSPVVSAYENDSLTQITAGITLGVDHDSVTGLNLLTIVATAANGYEAGKDYSLVITTGTVGGVSVVGEVVGEFTIERSAAAKDLANATDGLGAIKTETASIQSDTDNIQTRLPAALVGGRMDSDIGAKTGNVALSTQEKADVNAEVDTALADVNLDHLVGTAAPADAPADTYLDRLADDGTATYDRTTDSLQAIRDRGDTAWITGGGGGITDILSITPNIPVIDLANTATVRIGLILINGLDDLPTTAEITPGTISIERKAIGGTSWSAVVTDAAMSEKAGEVYYDEVFDSGSGYAAGDSIRITFKSQKITVSANDYEITDATGIMFQTFIREAMRGTDSAALASVATEARLAELDAANLPTDIANVQSDTDNIQTRLPAALVGGRMDSDVGNIQSGVIDADAIAANAIGASELATDAVNEIRDAILSDSTPFAGANLDATISSRATPAQVNTEVDNALDTAIPVSPTANSINERLQTLDDHDLVTKIPNVLSLANINAEVDTALDDAVADSIPADGSRPSIRQALYMIAQFLFDRNYAGTTVTVRKPDGTTTLMTLTLDDATNPTDITRTT